MAFGLRPSREIIQPPNTKLTGERRKHNHTADQIPLPKEKAPITPERSESGAADVRRFRI